MDPFTDDQVDYLARYLAKTFISRKDVKAEQMPYHKGSAYRPIHEPWKLSDLRAHVRGEKTFGHYLLDQDSMVKFIAFDVDLETQGTYCNFSFEEQERLFAIPGFMIEDYEWTHFNPREAWLDHSHPGRPWMKYQMQGLARGLSRTIESLGLKSYATYSGSKGVHVYGIFDELVPAETAREVAFEVLEKSSGRGPISAGLKFTPTRGKNFYHLAPDWDNPLNVAALLHYDLFDNFTVEVFPKQSHIEPLRLGNLMRLDFGKNLKAPEEQTFVIDMDRSEMQLEPHKTFDELKWTLEHGYNW